MRKRLLKVFKRSDTSLDKRTTESYAGENSERRKVK
jgi:hypothetical protein